VTRTRGAGRPLLTLALLLAVSAGSGCRRAVASLGADHAEARVRADELLGVLAGRFGAVERDRTFDSIRPRLARAALVPSRIYKDQSVWSSSDGATRTLLFSGRRVGDGYRLSVVDHAPAPDQPGVYRGTLHLRSIAPGEFEWTMRDELAIGAVRAEQLAAALTSVLQAAETVPEGAAASQLRSELPRTRTALAPLFSLTELRLAPVESGGTSVVVGFALDDSAPRSAYPKYGRYLQKYFAPMRLVATALDASGAAFWELRFRDGKGTLRLRVRGGDLLALEGEPRPVPDVLRARSQVSMKSGLFRVGARKLDAEVRLTRKPRDKSFVATFRAEPDWELPFFIEPLLRAPLRRPFQGEGALLELAVRDGEGPQTLVTRDYRVAVRESWIVRWLGGLGSEAVDDFRRGAEAEADRFYGAVLGAFRADALALLSAPEREDGGARR
jgi:hypothetical protein